MSPQAIQSLIMISGIVGAAIASYFGGLIGVKTALARHDAEIENLKDRQDRLEQRIDSHFSGARPIRRG